MKDCSVNKTKQESIINNQEIDSHIITIEYSLDITHTSIQSIHLMYIKGNETVFDEIIPMVEISFSDKYQNVTEVERTKPKIKKQKIKSVI